MARLVVLLFVLLLPVMAPVLAQSQRAGEGAGEGAGDGRTLHVFGWPDYVDQATLEAFTRETGIAVRYETYTSLAMLEAVLAGGHSSHDIVMPTNGPTLARLVEDGLLAPIDRSLVPNWRNLDPALMRWVEGADPGNLHGPIYLWGTLGLALRPDLVRARLPDAPLDSLDLLFRPEQAARLADCGIRMLDSPIVVMPPLLDYLGHGPDSVAPEHLAEAADLLAGIRPHIGSFAGRLTEDDLADGRICLALAYSGNALRARAAARAEDGPGAVDFVLPREGTQVTFDILAIPANAPDKEAAHAFIDFLLRPEVIAVVTNATRYPNAVPDSHPMVDPDLLADESIFPPAERMAGFHTQGGMAIGDRMARNRVWNRFKDGD